MENVLLNFYVNAWQATPEGGTLLLETRDVALDQASSKALDLPPGDCARVRVRNNGIGMDPKTLKQIFNPFFTTKQKGRGTGLGLASVYGIIKNHRAPSMRKANPVKGRHLTSTCRLRQNRLLRNAY